VRLNLKDDADLKELMNTIAEQKKTKHQQMQAQMQQMAAQMA